MEKKKFLQDAGFIIAALIICVILIIGSGYITQINKTGQAYIFPPGQQHTIYNLLQGISQDSSGYRFVVPDNPSPQLISAVSGLSNKLNFVGNATVIESELAKLPQSSKNYLLYISKNPSLSAQAHITIEEGSNIIVLHAEGTDETSLINAANILSTYTSHQSQLSSSCVEIDSSGIRDCSCYSDPDCSSSQFCEFPLCPDTPTYVQQQGVCTDIPLYCPTLYDPVCGCDGTAYANDCVRLIAKVSKRYDGACINQPPAPNIAPTINEIKLTSNSQGFKSVIGSTAVLDSVAAIDIAGFLKIDKTIDDLQIIENTGTYEIVIGGPCVNRRAADLLELPFPSCEAASTIPTNKGIIQTFNNDGKTQVLIAGWEALDTRIAARAIVRYLEFQDKLNENKVITYGTSLDDVDVEEIFDIIKIKPSSDNTISLEAPLKDYDIRLDLLTDTDSDGDFDVVGGSTTKRLITETCNQFTFDMDTDEYFIVTRMNGADGETGVFQVSKINDIDGVTVKDYAGKVVAENKKVSKTFDLAGNTVTVMGYSQSAMNVTFLVNTFNGCMDRTLVTRDGLTAVLLPSNRFLPYYNRLFSFGIHEKDVDGNIGMGLRTNISLGFNYYIETSVLMIKEDSMLRGFQEIGDTRVYEAFSPSARWLWDKSGDQYSLEIQYPYQDNP